MTLDFAPLTHDELNARVTEYANRIAWRVAAELRSGGDLTTVEPDLRAYASAMEAYQAAAMQRVGWSS